MLIEHGWDSLFFSKVIHPCHSYYSYHVLQALYVHTRTHSHANTHTHTHTHAHTHIYTHTYIWFVYFISWDIRLSGLFNSKGLKKNSMYVWMYVQIFNILFNTRAYVNMAVYLFVLIFYRNLNAYTLVHMYTFRERKGERHTHLCVYACVRDLLNNWYV